MLSPLRLRIVLLTVLHVGSSLLLAAGTAFTPAEEVAALRAQLAAQEAQIEQLKSSVAAQKQVLDRLTGSYASAALPVQSQSGHVEGKSGLVQSQSGPAASVGKPEGAPASVGGFQFSGDFRYRLDAQLREGNSAAPPLQNIRSRYRLRLNIDKEIDPRFKFHMQLSTGPLQNPTTNDQEMAGGVTKHLMALSEAWIDFHPGKKFSLRGGRMEEVFADNMRFLWDDDVRFNGFQQIVKVPLATNALGLTGLEFRSGEYILSNPAVYILPASSPYVGAGYTVGKKVRDANLFHPGLVLRGALGTAWSQQFMGGIQLYRNANQIRLASTLSGSLLVVDNAIGVALSGPSGAAGTAITQPGGAMFSAPHFQIAHVGWRLERKGWKIGSREMPLWFDLQGSRNVGTSRLRDAVMASANLGTVKKFGDLRFLYQFAIKDGNSMISQFSDDDLGTQSGVNIAVHGVRFDLGLTRFLQFQNLLFFQNQRRASDPANQFFVPLPRGANQTLRYLGQLAFTF